MPHFTHILALAAFAVAAAPAARADAIPPPAELSDVQKSLIGIWQEESCVMPEGLGHSCLTRIVAFGNETYSELDLGMMSMSNQFGTVASTGTWKGTQTDPRTIAVTVTHADGTTSDLTLVMESAGALLFKDSANAMFPASRFTRGGSPIQETK